MHKYIVALAGLALVGAPALATDESPRAERAQARLDKALQGLMAGKPVDCINLGTVRSTEVIDGRAIVYKVGRKVYVNYPDFGASSLRRDDILVTRTWGRQLCSLDTVRLVDSGMRFPRGVIGLGQFVPYSALKPQG